MCTKYANMKLTDTVKGAGHLVAYFPVGRKWRNMKNFWKTIVQLLKIVYDIARDCDIYLFLNGYTVALFLETRSFSGMSRFKYSTCNASFLDGQTKGFVWRTFPSMILRGQLRANGSLPRGEKERFFTDGLMPHIKALERQTREIGGAVGTYSKGLQS